MIIGWLKGRVISTGLDNVLIDVNGVGYVANAGGRLLGKLSPGEETELHVETKVTENSIQMYAFGSDEERAWFVRLQDVHGVAGKAAMAILDAVSVPELMDAIALGDAATLTRAKGVGKKLGERIVGELAGKPPPMGRFGKFEVSGGSGIVSEQPKSGARGEAVSALVNLGYGQTDAARAVAAAAKGEKDASIEVLIKGALKELAA